MQKGSRIYSGRNNESNKYWISVLKNRGVQDMLLLCADRLTGIKESISVVFPCIENQRCIAHQARNALKYMADKDKKELAMDLKKIYHATSVEAGMVFLVEVAMKS